MIRVVGPARRRATTANPSRPGMLTSDTIRSGVASETRGQRFLTTRCQGHLVASGTKGMRNQRANRLLVIHYENGSRALARHGGKGVMRSQSNAGARATVASAGCMPRTGGCSSATRSTVGIQVANQLRLIFVAVLINGVAHCNGEDLVLRPRNVETAVLLTRKQSAVGKLA